MGEAHLHRARRNLGKDPTSQSPDSVAVIHLRRNSPFHEDSREGICMAKYDGIIGRDILTVTEGENELTIVLRDNRFLFIKVINGKLVADSVPE